MRVAFIQPRSATGTEESRNLEDALAWLDRSAEAGVDLVVFPECYPGPANPANSYDAMGPLAERAAARGLHVIAGRIEPAHGDGHYVTLHLIDDAGETVGVYRRTTPHGPYVYRDLPAWDFDYTAASDELPVFETRIGRIGMLVCSEVYMPELSRVLALRGAELIVYPAGGAQNELADSWRTILHARAIENLLYTGASQNLYEEDEQGIALVASPEGVLQQRVDEGMLVADLDMDRIRFLREEDERIEFPKRYATVPGLLRWRRPELYEDLLAATEHARVDAVANEA